MEEIKEQDLSIELKPLEMCYPILLFIGYIDISIGSSGWMSHNGKNVCPVQTVNLYSLCHLITHNTNSPERACSISSDFQWELADQHNPVREY